MLFMLDLEEFSFYYAKPLIIRNNVQMPQKPIVSYKELTTYTVHLPVGNILKPKNDRTFTLEWWVSCGTSGLFLATRRSFDLSDTAVIYCDAIVWVKTVCTEALRLCCSNLIPDWESSAFLITWMGFKNMRELHISFPFTKPVGKEMSDDWLEVQKCSKKFDFFFSRKNWSFVGDMQPWWYCVFQKRLSSFFNANVFFRTTR